VQSDGLKLSFLDSGFLKLESSSRPFHVAGLMIFKLPSDAPAGYLRKLAKNCGRLNELWPIYNRKLNDPDDLKNASWVEEDNYDPARHVMHYALPSPGRMEDLLKLVSAAHERTLDRSRPLWEMHVIEGLSGNRFALYSKVHHALVDGVGALRMTDAMFSDSPDQRFHLGRAKPIAEAHHKRIGLLREMGDMTKGLAKQYSAVPQLSSLLAHLGLDAWRGNKEAMPLPFTAPRTLFNENVDSRRRIVVCDLSLKQVRAIERKTGGTVNDILLAVCGSALRKYLIEQKALPRKSLIAGLPVSLKKAGQQEGNQVSFMFCPFFTNERDELRRLNKVIRVTRKAKEELSHLSTTAAQDFANMVLMPTILLTLSGNATRFNPAINAIFSNIKGSPKKLYLEGAELQAVYPLSIVTDGMGINLTVIGYGGKLSFAITTCPTLQPGIENFGKLLTQSFRDLKEAIKKG